MSKRTNLRRELGMLLYGQPLTRRPRFGIFDATLNPIHYGHLLSAQWVRWGAGLDKMMFCTAGTPPNPKADVLPPEDRHDLTILGTMGNQHFEPCRVNLHSSGMSYAANAVERVIELYGGNIDPYFVVSSEYLNPQHQWYIRDWVLGKELFRMVKNIIVFPRENDTMEQIAAWAKLVPECKVRPVWTPHQPLSSTMIREWWKSGRSIWYTTPWRVQQQIEKERHWLSRGQKPYTPNACEDDDVKAVAIFPGQFDPISYSDLLRGEYARQEKGLDRVIYVPSSRPPNNPGIITPAEARYEMALAGTLGNPYFRAHRVEVDRDGMSYTYLTVEHFRAVYGKDVQLYVIINSDFLNPKNRHHLTKWGSADKLFKMVKFLAFPNDWTQMEETKRWASQIPNADIEVIYAPSLHITQADIRELVRLGRTTMYTTPADVQDVIYRRGLYRDRNTPAPGTVIMPD